MQLRIRLLKERRERKPGTLVCAKCKARHQFALYEGGVCKSCFVPKAIAPVARGPSREIRPQSDATLLLRARCQEIMDRLGLSRQELARRIGLDRQRMYLWWTKHLGDAGQITVNAIVDVGLDALGEVSA